MGKIIDIKTAKGWKRQPKIWQHCDAEQIDLIQAAYCAGLSTVDTMNIMGEIDDTYADVLSWNYDDGDDDNAA